MNLLWKHPNVVAKLLSYSDKEDVRKNLAPFFVNNFYENILSSVYIEDNLMYLISLLLMDEINALDKIKENNFLEKSAVGYLLEQLKNKSDIQTYFKTIMLSLVEKLEMISSSKKINFDVKEIEKDFKKTKELMDQKSQKMGIKQKVIDRNFFRKNITTEEQESVFFEDEYLNAVVKDTREKELFNLKYLPDITKDELENKLRENRGNKGMEEYLNIQLDNYQKNNKIFSNEKFLNNVYESTVSSEVLALYQIDFFKIIKILDELFKNLMNNIYLLPYSVKCICKIISILIKKKFPKINTIEQNYIISKFFFCKLLLPIFIDPKFGALINNFIISGTTLDNLKIISNIIEKFISGSLIKCDEKNGDYSPFNWYFLEKMPELLDFFKNITKVILPPFIEKLINEKLPNDFEFNYFDENPEEIVFHRSLCFSIDDLYVLISNMEKCQDKLFTNKNDKNLSYLNKTFEKIVLNSNKSIIEGLRNKTEYEIINSEKKNKKEKNGKKLLNYYLLTELLINDKYQKLFKLKQDFPNFTLKELNTINNKDETQKNNTIKAKNFLSSLLYNYRQLVKTDFDEGTTINTIKILKELKKFMKTANFVIDGTIPSEWYVNSLITQLRLLPTNLHENDYENLYNEMEREVINSIKELDFETISICLGKVKFAKRGRIYYENAKNTIIDIELNTKAQSIIEKGVIPSAINFKYTEKEKEFIIEKGKNIKEAPLMNISNNDNERKKNCVTIESFANKFPNIGKIEQLQEINLLDLLEELNLPEQMSNYFKLIKDYLTKNLNMDENQKEFKDINNKIFDYVMEKIYEKIYPAESLEEDNLIFKNCILLSWTEPKHFAINTNYIFDSFLPDVIGYFNKIEKEKSPRKKLENMTNIFVCVENVVKFNGDNKEIGLDGLIPILNYAFIKVHPLNIYTNCRYMNLFLGSKRNREEGNLLASLMVICEFVKNISDKVLYGVSPEQYAKNCEIACLNNCD